MIRKGPGGAQFVKETAEAGWIKQKHRERIALRNIVEQTLISKYVQSSAINVRKRRVYDLQESSMF
jgi:hypothetical protein